MAIPTIQITGHVLTPSGVAVTSGTIDLSLSAPGSIADGAVSERLPGGKYSSPAYRITLDAGGALPSSARVAPNGSITPDGTYYTARFSCVVPGSTTPIIWTERWSLASSPSSIAIGAIPRLDIVPGVAVAYESAVQAEVLAVATGARDTATTSASGALAAAGAATSAAASALSSAGTVSTTAASVASSVTEIERIRTELGTSLDLLPYVAMASSRTGLLAAQGASILRSLWDRRSGVLSRVKISDLPAGALATAFVGTLGEPVPYTFTRAGTGHVLLDGTLVSVTNNVPRIHQTPRGVEIMPVTGNLLATSQDPTGWSKTGIGVTNTGAVAAPDGSLTALTCEETATTGNHWFWPPNSTVVADAYYVHSVYVKAGLRTKVGIRDSGSQNTVIFDLVALTTPSVVVQAGGSAGIQDCGSGWRRCWMAVHRNTTSTATVVFGCDDGGSNNYTGTAGTAAFYVWGPQVVAGSVLKPFVPSTASLPDVVAAESLAIESRITGAHRAWCRSITAMPSGSWADAKQLWSQGSGANSASLAVTGGNLVFTVTDSTATAKTLTYPVTSISAGVHTIKASVRDGALAMYIDGVSVGSAGGTGTGLVASLPATLYLGGAPGSEFGGTLSDFVESDNSVPANCPPPDVSVVSTSASSCRVHIISDTHGMASWIAEGITKSKGWGPHLLAHLGDIVWEPADDAAWATAWAPLNSVFQSAGVARGMVLGNHDVNSAGLTAAGVRAAWPADMTARLQPSVFYGYEDIAGVRFIFLDATYQSTEPATRTGMGTGTNNVAGYIPAAELTWMNATIDASILPCVIFTHQPLLIEGTVGSITNRADVQAALEARKTKIAAVVNGHSHAPAHAVWHGINYFAVESMNSPIETITTHNRGRHQQLEVDTVSRAVRFSFWEDDSAKGYLEVRTIIVPY